jgi:antitoxin YefM
MPTAGPASPNTFSSICHDAEMPTGSGSKAIGWRREGGTRRGTRTIDPAHCSDWGNATPRFADSYAFSYDSRMKTITASKARANLYRLIEETSESSEPVQITGKRANAVLVSEEDWRAIQETMYLLSIPGMRESIREGLEARLEECVEEIEW